MVDRRGNLRERKKLKTRASIQAEALRLFQEKGFKETTVEEIARAAEVSISTVFNYFPAKEDIVMQDDLDPLVLAAYNAQPADMHPVAALRRAMRLVFTSLPADAERAFTRRMALIVADEDLRAAMLIRFGRMLDEIAEVVRLRAGGLADDFKVRNLSGAVLGVMMSAMIYSAGQPQGDLLASLDAALEHLECGLRLE